MSSSPLEVRLERCTTLPTLPAVALKVLEQCRRPDPDLNGIATTISSDAALSMRLLKMVNSAVFGLKQEVKTVQHAIALLGLISVRTLALSFSLAQGLKKSQQTGFKTFWKRSVLSGVAARELVRVAKRRDAEEAFLAGLLQDIGVLALGQVGTKKFENLSANKVDDHTAIIAHEKLEFGVDHAEAGSWLAQKWQLPTPFVTAIRWSHEPEALPEETPIDIALLVRSVAVGGLIADIWIHPQPGVATEIAERVAREQLNIDGPALETVLTAVRSHADDVGQFLDVQIGSKAELGAILDQAKEALVILSMQASHQAAAVQRTVSSLEARAKELELEAHRDALTEIANRGWLERVLDEELATAQNQGRTLSLVMVDIDKFKSINDSRGHLGGDRVLKEVAQLLAKSIRPRDTVGRYGGEEFVLVLPDTPAGGAAVVAERIRARLEATIINLDKDNSLNVTASFGCATYDPDVHVTKKDIIGDADRALYAAKRTGRNRVVSAGDLDVATTAEMPAVKLPAAVGE